MQDGGAGLRAGPVISLPMRGSVTTIWVNGLAEAEFWFRLTVVGA